MKKEWLEKYRESLKTEHNSTVLTGFNAHIDSSLKFDSSRINLEKVESELLNKVSSEEDLKKVLKYCKENKSNQEVQLDFNPEISGHEQLGGQAGIIANFQSRIGNKSIIYTPFLSEKVSNLVDEEVFYPVIEDNLKLKRVKQGINTDRTKKNYIIELEEESCRLILSDSLRGFGPYFRKSLEEKLEKTNHEIDRIILSGFHDAEGNVESKLMKSEKQLEKIETDKHLEFVSKGEEVDQMMLEHIAPQFTSIGMDEQELRNISETLGVDLGDATLGHVYNAVKKIIEETGVERIHVHTYNFQCVVAKKSYEVDAKDIRRGMLFGGLAGVSMAEQGELPSKDQIKINSEKMHINRLDELEDFQNYFELENFVETGIAELEEYKVVATPTIIHEEPKRLVGMGDVISSGSFMTEIN